MTDDFTLIIQGPIHRNMITMAMLHPHLTTIISTWDDSSWTHPTIEEYLQPIKRPNLQIIINRPIKQEKLDRVYNKQNRYLQFFTTQKALMWTQTKYAIKVRSDEYYSNLDPIIHALLLEDNKMITNDVFFRRIEYLRYHPSDHIICCKTEKFKDLISRLMYDCQFNQDALKYAPFNQFDFFIFVEQQIGMKWIEMHEKIDQYPYKIPSDFAEAKRLMIKYFDIVGNSMLGDFFVVANSEKRTYINEYSYFDPAKDIQTSLEEL